MKYLILALISTFFMASCTVDLEVSPETVETDFIGIYIGTLNCTGTLAEDNGEEITVLVSRATADAAYIIDLGDDVIFQGQTVNNVLVIDQQTLNEDFDFDVVTLSGSITQMNDQGYQFEFIHEVDEDGESNCSISLIKQ